MAYQYAQMAILCPKLAQLSKMVQMIGFHGSCLFHDETGLPFHFLPDVTVLSTQ